MLSAAFSRFMLNVEKRLTERGETPERKKSILDKIKADIENDDWCQFLEPDEEDDYDTPEDEQPFYVTDVSTPLVHSIGQSIDEKIRLKQIALNIEPDEPIKKPTDMLSLHDAVRFGNTLSIKQCLGHGVDPKLKNNNGHTAYDIAVLHEDKVIMDLLEELGAAF